MGRCWSSTRRVNYSAQISKKEENSMYNHMGRCWSSSTRRARDGSQISEEEENSMYNRVYEQSPAAMSAEIDQLILDLLAVAATLVNNNQALPLPLVRIHDIADQDGGWVHIICSMIRVIPLGDPLGQHVITLVLDECPLPTKDLISKITPTLGLSISRALMKGSDISNERNIFLILGYIAEKLAGPISVILLNEDCLGYHIAHLRVSNDPNIILSAIISLEKFAKNRETKSVIMRKLKESNPLIELQNKIHSTDYAWRQVGFCAVWCLDNIFLVEGREYSFESVDRSNINAVLNSNDVSLYLKIAPNGLEARCDSHSFESVRCTFQMDTGSWYYETLIITPGVMQIGWATKDSNYLNHEGYGIGDDPYSVAYDGCRRLVWYNAIPIYQTCPAWKPGDILGCYVNIDQKYMSFYLNGKILTTSHSMFLTVKSGIFAAASFMSFQQCKFNFGAEPFKFTPGTENFQSFNEHGHLMENQKIIWPRHLVTVDTSVKEDSCTLCCERKADVILDPCQHRGFCFICSTLLTECPLCRSSINVVREFVETD